MACGQGARAGQEASEKRRKIGQTRSDPVLGGKLRLRVRDGPVDAEIRIVPEHGTVVLGGRAGFWVSERQCRARAKHKTHNAGSYGKADPSILPKVAEAGSLSSVRYPNAVVTAGQAPMPLFEAE